MAINQGKYSVSNKFPHHWIDLGYHREEILFFWVCGPLKLPKSMTKSILPKLTLTQLRLTWFLRQDKNICFAISARPEQTHSRDEKIEVESGTPMQQGAPKPKQVAWCRSAVVRPSFKTRAGLLPRLNIVLDLQPSRQTSRAPEQVGNHGVCMGQSIRSLFFQTNFIFSCHLSNTILSVYSVLAGKLSQNW